MYPRFVETRVRKVLAYRRVVMVCGPRQSGKTTLVRKIGGSAMPYFNLDEEPTREIATEDPVGFVRSLDRAVIDEIQRAPDLVLEIKSSVDADPRPGRFLLTGSAEWLGLPKAADSLAGRMSIVRLLPLAQAELHEGCQPVLEQLFAGKVPDPGLPVLGEDLVAMVLAGGFPEALAYADLRQAQEWHRDYLEALLRKDASDTARIEQVALLPPLLRSLAEHSGKLVNASAIGAPLGMNHVTTRKYTRVLENLFLLHHLPPWHSNALKRIVKTPKVHFLDSGLLATVRGVTPEKLRRDRTALGPLLETFVLGEILKTANWSGDRYELSHFRDAEQNEVDIVIEDGAGRIVGIEVKASATVRRRDSIGLRRLASATGDQFALGLVLHDGDRSVPLGERMVAAPLSTLWGGAQAERDD